MWSLCSSDAEFVKFSSKSTVKWMNINSSDKSMRNFSQKYVINNLNTKSTNRQLNLWKIHVKRTRFHFLRCLRPRKSKKPVVLEKVTNINKAGGGPIHFPISPIPWCGYTTHACWATICIANILRFDTKEVEWDVECKSLFVGLREDSYYHEGWGKEKLQSKYFMNRQIDRMREWQIKIFK